METPGRAEISHIHAFPYSQRPGTPAAAMANQVNSQVKKERVEIVNALSARQKDELLARMVGKTVHVLIERQDGAKGEAFGNYERVCAEGLTEPCEGAIVPVVLDRADNHILYGTLKEDA